MRLDVHAAHPIAFALWLFDQVAPNETTRACHPEPDSASDTWRPWIHWLASARITRWCFAILLNSFEEIKIFLARHTSRPHIVPDNRHVNLSVLWYDDRAFGSGANQDMM